MNEKYSLKTNFENKLKALSDNKAIKLQDMQMVDSAKAAIQKNGGLFF